ncbi:MAG: hypothetical protein LBJ72_14265 [Dysgonamonadaceae bacterium]|jgi:hypothetical protein|nr:hypothetical protein [Dysgonamonadaceae bacterium]
MFNIKIQFMDNSDENRNKTVKYLYGASVQGIQDFIFQTNKLKEIVGASEIVADICTTAFKEYEKNGESIVRAAGNIKHIFNNKEDCEKAALNFPKKVMTMAPGITISQAVVKLKDDLSDYKNQADNLEKLLINQRNRQVRPMTLGLMAIKRSPATGLPAVKEEDNVLIDEASDKKEQYNAVKKLAERSFGINLTDKQIAYDIDKITGKNNWIAVIHADGNGIGNIVRAVGDDKEDMKRFSGMLDDITKIAANAAYEKVKDKFASKVIPLRPVVLSGDDMTLICRADLAIDYTKCFIEKFEKESKKQFETIVLKKTENQKLINQGLTVCAGIAFVKSSYPFHYAVHLAETLCSRAKNAAKKIDEKLAPSCLFFHKVQDSFVENFDKIAERELTPKPNLSFEAGPYYCGNRAMDIHKEKCTAKLDCLISGTTKLGGSSIKSHLRQWVEMLFDNIDAANQKMKRLRAVNRQAKDFDLEKYEKLNATDHVIIPFYDMLSLASILQTETKNKKED